MMESKHDSRPLACLPDRVSVGIIERFEDVLTESNFRCDHIVPHPKVALREGLPMAISISIGLTMGAEPKPSSLKGNLDFRALLS
jgi:hypothetical protein